MIRNAICGTRAASAQLVLVLRGHPRAEALKKTIREIPILLILLWPRLAAEPSNGRDAGRFVDGERGRRVANTS